MDSNKGPQLELDNVSERNFVNFFNSLSQDGDTLRLFERSSNNSTYYSLHGADAILVSKQVFKTSTVLKYWYGDIKTGLATCILNLNVGQEFLKQQSQVKKLELWQTDRGSKSNWSIFKKSSPGNLEAVEDILFSNTELTSIPVTLCLCLNVKGDVKEFGASFLDTNTSNIGLVQFVDNDMFSNLESLLIQIEAKECLLLVNKSLNYEIEKIKRIFDRMNVMLSMSARSFVSETQLSSELTQLLSSINLNLDDSKLAVASCQGLIKYLNFTIDDTTSFYNHDLNQFMRLDSAALAALNLFPQTYGNNGIQSLFQLFLPHLRTSQGSRLLSLWLKQPLTDLNAIQARLQLVHHFIDQLTVTQTLQSWLRKVPDLSRLSRKFSRGKANLQDVLRIYQLLLILPNLLETFAEAIDPEVFGTYSQQLEEYKDGLEKLKELVETTVDLKRADNHQYMLLPTFDQGLTDLHHQIQELEAQMSTQHQKMADVLDLEEKKLKLEKATQFGYCFKLSKTEAKALKKVPNQIIELAVLTSGTQFTTKKLKQTNEEYQQLTDQFQDLQSVLIKEILTVVNTYFSTLDKLNALLAHLDVIVSFASLASSNRYVEPTFCTENDTLHLTEARHPCLEVQPDVSFIPNPITTSRTQKYFVVITGPNMGGKSTFMRQVGVIALMAQIGSYVPCTTAKLPLFDAILARVGANDLQQKGVSTFMAEMLETASILRTATPNSLILIDELGRGTSTTDGFGLAWAISKYLITQTKAITLFATHFHELTELEDQFPTEVKNLQATVHVQKDGNLDKVVLLYNIVDGKCDQSFGIQVANMCRFPEEVIHLAKRKVEQLEHPQQSVLNDEIKEAVNHFTNHPNDTEIAEKLIKVVREM